MTGPAHPAQQQLHHPGLPPLLGGCEHHSALAALKTLDFQAAFLPPVTMPSQGGAHRRSLLLMKPQENKSPLHTRAGLCPLRAAPAPHHSLCWMAGGGPVVLPCPHCEVPEKGQW